MRMLNLNKIFYLFVGVLLFGTTNAFCFINDGTFPILHSIEDAPSKNSLPLSTSIANLQIDGRQSLSTSFGGGYSEVSGFFYFLSLGKEFSNSLAGTISYQSYQSGIFSNIVTPRLYIQNCWDDFEQVGIKTKLTANYINFQSGPAAISLRANILASKTFGIFTLFGGYRFPIVQGALDPHYSLTGENTKAYGYLGAEIKISPILNIYSQIYQDFFGVGISVTSPIGSFPLVLGKNQSGNLETKFGHPFWDD